MVIFDSSAPIGIRFLICNSAGLAYSRSSFLIQNKHFILAILFFTGTDTPQNTRWVEAILRPGLYFVVVFHPEA